jgi:endonuclease/exonuclease/phosphatase family metal-dependent hydrolase
VALLQPALQDWISHRRTEKLRVCLDSADYFAHRHDNTIFIQDADEDRSSTLKGLRRAVLAALGQKEGNFRMHMSIGQSTNEKGDPHKFLLSKAGYLPSVEWDVGQLAILVRQRSAEGDTTIMKLWGSISLTDGSSSGPTNHSGFYCKSSLLSLAVKDEEDGGDVAEDDVEAEVDSLQSSSSYCFNDEFYLWEPCDGSLDEPGPEKQLAVASYNVLAEFVWPPSRERYPVIVKNLLSARAESDVVALQEVTDDFLCHLLRDQQIRDTYPYVSHGPPDQADISPLPSLTNLVILSKSPFTWQWVSFKRQHKGAVVAKFERLGTYGRGEFRPLVMATVHLTCGLTDGSVANKKIELQRIVKYLESAYKDHAWILLGDFNMATSSYSVETALKNKAIAPRTAGILTEMEEMLESAGLVDAWRHCRHELGQADDV